MLTKAERRNAFLFVLLAVFSVTCFAVPGSRTSRGRSENKSKSTARSSGRSSTASARESNNRQVQATVSRGQIRQSAKQTRNSAPEISRGSHQRSSRNNERNSSRINTNRGQGSSRKQPSINRPSHGHQRSTNRIVEQNHHRRVDPGHSVKSETGRNFGSKSYSVHIGDKSRNYGRSNENTETGLFRGFHNRFNRGHSSRPTSTVLKAYSGQRNNKYFEKPLNGGTEVRSVYSNAVKLDSELVQVVRSGSVLRGKTRQKKEWENPVRVVDVHDRKQFNKSSVFDRSNSRGKKDSGKGSESRVRTFSIKDRLSKPNLSNTIDRVISEKKTVSFKKSKNVNINGDNNIYVEGDYHEAKDYKPARDYRHYSKINHSTEHIHYLTNNQFCNCGRFHLMRWSNSSCSRIVYFRQGLNFGFSYIYPEYHRKYLFVSIGGHWPHSYRYRRYYWYGCHPNRWYGAQPYVYPSVDNSVTNIYNYNTADTGNSGSYSDSYSDSDSYGTVYRSSYAGSDSSYQTSNGSSYEVDYDAFSDVRERLAAEQSRQVSEAQTVEDAPVEKSAADIYFDNAVEAFAGGDYKAAVEAVTKAMLLAPEDEVLGFTLVQSLFADGRDVRAALQLRAIFENMPRNKEAIYYPRGLYADQEVLERQISELERKVENDPDNGELNLLLAYHRLGTGEFDKAAGPLARAKYDADNLAAAAIMEDLLEEARENELMGNDL